MIIYLSGINSNTSTEELDRLKLDLLDLDCTLIIPESKELDKLGWLENLDFRLNFLNCSSAIYMLPNWKNCIMPRIELTAAMDEKIPLCFSIHDIKELITTLDD